MKNINKKGFTLAETLVTLVVIGIIASLTIPILMSYTKEQEFRTSLRKAINTLNNAVKMQYSVDRTQVSDYAGDADSLRTNLFKQRLNVINTANNQTMAGVTGQTVFYTVDGMKFGIATSYSGGSNCDSLSVNPCYDVYIDVNGDKTPNTETTDATKPKDIYHAMIYAQRVIPQGGTTQTVFYDALN